MCQSWYLESWIEKIMTMNKNDKDQKEEYVIYFNYFYLNLNFFMNQWNIIFYFRIQRRNQYRLTKYPLRNGCFLPINKILYALKQVEKRFSRCVYKRSCNEFFTWYIFCNNLDYIINSLHPVSLLWLATSLKIHRFYRNEL